VGKDKAKSIWNKEKEMLKSRKSTQEKTEINLIYPELPK
jgi:hypothetical protein